MLIFGATAVTADQLAQGDVEQVKEFGRKHRDFVDQQHA